MSCSGTGFWGTAGALLLMPAARGEAAGVAATSLALGAAGLARGGFSVNHMDIAPQYAGVVMGISNTAGTLAGARAAGWAARALLLAAGAGLRHGTVIDVGMRHVWHMLELCGCRYVSAPRDDGSPASSRGAASCAPSFVPPRPSRPCAVHAVSELQTLNDLEQCAVRIHIRPCNCGASAR